MEENIERPVRGAAFHAEGEWAVPEGYEAEIKDGKIIVRKKESEDERIRKEIVEFIQWATDRGSVPDKQFQAKRPGEWLAYLEKMKDSKWSPSEDEMGVLYKLCYISKQVTDEDDTELTRLYQDLKREYFNGHSFENMFPSEKQKEQKPAEWTGYSGIVIDKTKHPELSNAEWAIVRGFARIAGHSHFPITIIKETAQDFLAHLPAEWSEEDEKNWEQVLAYIPDDAIKGWMEKQKARIIAGIKPDQIAEYEKIKNTIAKCLACGKRDGVINDEENILCLDWIEQQGAPWFGEDAATRPDKEEHQCDCQHVGCHINNCRRWCQKFNNEVPYEFCGPTCSSYSHKNTEGISVKKPTWTGNDSMAIVSLEAIINNSNHDEARKKELLDWIQGRLGPQDGELMWLFAEAGTKFNEDVLLVCEDREPRISRCAVNNGYYLPTSMILPPKSVTDKLVAQYGESHGEPAPDN